MLGQRLGGHQLLERRDDDAIELQHHLAHGQPELGIGASGDGELEPRRQRGPLPLLPHQLDEGADSDGLLGQARRDEVLDHPVQHVLQRGEQQRAAGREVVQQRAPGDAGPPAHLDGGRTRIPALHQRIDRVLEKSLAGGQRPGLARGHGGSGTVSIDCLAVSATNSQA